MAVNNGPSCHLQVGAGRMIVVGVARNAPRSTSWARRGEISIMARNVQRVT
ncbi:MAG: hypothetical protein ACI8W7_004896 [Gammaproteobacteria bacterium]|jgi:hypothetical protein